MDELRVVGFDPSLRNWGVASGLYNVSTQRLTINHLEVIKPTALCGGKKVRVNSRDIDSARQLASKAKVHLKDAHAVFVEVPVGSQSSRAMASYGICVGILGALQEEKSFFEVTPNEVKLVATNNKKATKEDMINWAMNLHPEANWPTRTQKGQVEVIKGTAEHMADAVAAITAGLRSPEFQRLSSMRWPGP